MTDSALVEKLRAMPRCQCAGSIDDVGEPKITDLAAERLEQLSSPSEYRRGIEDAARVAEKLLVFADTTSGADVEIAAAIRALGKEEGR